MARGSAITIKQGDAYRLSIGVSDAPGGAALNITDVAKAEFCFGTTVRKVYPESADFDAAEGRFSVPLAQADTFSLAADETHELDVRVQFVNGDVVGILQKVPFYVADATSEEVL